MTLLVLYLVLALVVSFVCSLLEAVILSVTPTYVAALAAERPALGARLTALTHEIERPLAAILILNTVAHTVGAAGVGAQAVEVFGSAALGIASAILTFLVLVFSEIVPKSLGAAHWRALAPVATKVLRVLIVCLYPLVLGARGIAWLFGARERAPAISREELAVLADVAVDEGVASEAESRILRNLFRFRSVEGRDIMTPRTVLVAMDESATVADVVADEARMRFSRLIVYEESIENVTGFVLKHDLMIKLAAGELDSPLADVAREIEVLPETTRLPSLLDVMLRTAEHIVLLREDTGGTAGIVTLEDIVETLIGVEIVDETDMVIDMRELARKRWEQRARSRGLARPRRPTE